MDEVNPAPAYHHIFPAHVVDVVPDEPTSSCVPIPETILRAPHLADDVQQSLGSIGFCDDADDDENQVMSLSHLHTPCTSLAPVLWCAFERTIHSVLICDDSPIKIRAIYVMIVQLSICLISMRTCFYSQVGPILMTIRLGTVFSWRRSCHICLVFIAHRGAGRV